MTTGIPKYLNPRDLPFESEQLSIPYPDDKVFVEYIVLNNTRLDTLSKTRILDFEPKDVKGTYFRFCRFRLVPSLDTFAARGLQVPFFRLSLDTFCR